MDYVAHTEEYKGYTINVRQAVNYLTKMLRRTHTTRLSVDDDITTNDLNEATT